MFIKLGDTHINIAHIVAYGKTGPAAQNKTWVRTTGGVYYVNTKTSRISALLNEACRRQTGHNAVLAARDLEPM